MSVRIIVHKKTKRVLLDIGRHPQHFKTGIRKALGEIGIQNKREAKRLIRTGPKTGRKWPNLPNRSSAPFEAPAEQSGKLSKSIGYRVRNHTQMEIGASAESERGAPYPRFLEDGTRKMKPRPYLLKSVNNTARDAQKALQDYVAEEIGAT